MLLQVSAQVCGSWQRKDTSRSTNLITLSHPKPLPPPLQTILAADGELVMKVKEVKAESIIVEVTNDATLGERKNMNLPGVIVDLPTVTAKDADDLENFGAKHGVDFVAASFVRKGSDIGEWTCLYCQP